MESWRQQYPFESHHLDTGGGVRMHYIDEGPRSEEAVLLLHGNPTWSFYYRNVVLALRDRFRCIAPDHIGMGLSDKPADYPYTLARRVGDVRRLVAKLRLKRVHLILHDWGGAIGMGWATRNVDFTGRIVLLNTAAFPDSRIPRRIALCRIPYLGALVVRGANGFAGPAVSMSVVRSLPTDVREGYLAPYGNWADRVAVHQFVRDIPMEADHPTLPLLQQIGVDLAWLRQKSILIGWGGRDFCFNEHFFQRWRHIFPHAETEYYPEAGHYVLEDERERIIARIVEFLSR
jgi:haloalkane dehalogenase